MTIEEILAKLDNVTKTSTGYLAKCPVHEDSTPSLSISNGDDKRILIHCHAGCSTKNVVNAIGIHMSDLFPNDDTATALKQMAESSITEETHQKLVKTYDYTDKNGKLVFQVCRFEPKGFRQRRPDREKEGEWIWSIRGINKMLYHLPLIIKAKKRGDVVYLVEGEKDVEALESIGMTATCNAGGAGKWKPAYTETLDGCKVVILPDRDAPGRKHAETVRNSLTGNPKVVELPDRDNRKIKDAADWVAAGGTAEELREIVDNAPEWTAPTKNKDNRSKTSIENGKKGGRPPAPIALHTARQYTAEKLTIPDNGHLVARHWRGNWYRYSDGWHMISNGEMTKALITWMPTIPELETHSSVNYAKNVLLNLSSFDLCGIPTEQEKPCWLSTGEDARQWIAFSNGIAVNVWSYAEQLAAGKTPTNYTRPVSPDLFSSDFVQYPWNENAECPMFLEYLERVQPDPENFAAVMRLFGLAMADVTKWEVFFQLHGEASCGKTVALDVLEALVGYHNVSRVSLEALNPETRFQTFPLAYAKVNICGETPTNNGQTKLHAIEAMFKHAVSGGTIEVERKGLDKEIARCRARFVLAGNSLPTFADKSDAIWRRLRIIPFNVQIPLEERNANLSRDIIRNEMPGIAMMALDGLATIIREGRVLDCPSGKLQKMRHRETCDHERAFLEEEYSITSENDCVPNVEIYEDYRGWMKANGYRPMGAARFLQRVEEIYPEVFRDRRRIAGVLTRVLAGLRK